MASRNPVTKVVIHWFRRDLRLNDNTALIAATKSGLPVLPIFIFDPNILQHLKLKDDRRVTFIHQTLQQIKNLRIYHGEPATIYERLMDEFDVREVHYNEDYEPYARERDAKIEKICQARKVIFRAHKDHVIFSPGEVLKDDGSPYQVFTPYSRRWLTRLEDYPAIVGATASTRCFVDLGDHKNPSIENLGFLEHKGDIPAKKIDSVIIDNYAATRDIPSIRGTSRLGAHLRFGTISIRQLVVIALQSNQKFLVELIWREFYQMIIWHYPRTIKEPFNRIYAKMKYPGSRKDFDRWAAGRTGYPLVDAGMRELVATGFMHNRVRMVVASFLTKHLLCDWRWGEHFFAQHLLDFELASNVGGWQWAAGVGVDAAPYFRIFNPAEQQKKFDPKREYVDRWTKQANFFGTDELAPMVDHRFARERCLEFFSAVRRTK